MSPAAVANTPRHRRTARRTAIHTLIAARANSHGTWECCASTFPTQADINRHVQTTHQSDLAALQEKLLDSYLRPKPSPSPAAADTLPLPPPQLSSLAPFRIRRAPKGTSDSISLTCDCNGNGLVLLWYKYARISDTLALAASQQELCTRLKLTGKVRVAHEGINVTVAGETADVQRYIAEMSASELLSSEKGLLLSAENVDCERNRTRFFKPSAGCAHVFDGLSVRIVDEVCPFGVSGYLPADLFNNRRASTSPAAATVKSLPPPAFHSLLTHATTHSPETHIILDARNEYEHRLGHFTNALRPPIRRFADLPAYVSRKSATWKGKTVLTYCTGGVRCEKAARWIGENVAGVENVVMLDGGIHNYLEWVKEKEQQGGKEERKGDEEQSGGQAPPPPPPASPPPPPPTAANDTAKEQTLQTPFVNLFIGRNYVFDARQSLAPASSQPITDCVFCGQRTAVYAKCERAGCHLMVTCCAECEQAQRRAVFCCVKCKERDAIIAATTSTADEESVKAAKWWCDCETQRREKLYGPDPPDDAALTALTVGVDDAK
ncbi:hypothetical protein BDZ88DRAFT_432226 [Geranomyces variabilis]|nr:hypothetical protein BDZ88DRAFT_432226 [Geranomyces variabilis]KAJ3131466.1 thiosulfate sulfurtransferase (rhodanese)-like domain-containing protein 2 [Geranomyces variabilis]